MREERMLLVDDLDGTTADETVHLALDGQTWEIDLSAAHAAQLREQLRPWAEAARRTVEVRGRHRPVTRTTVPSTGVTRRRELEQIRLWARAQGHELSSRGRIPAEVEQAWRDSRGLEAAPAE